MPVPVVLFRSVLGGVTKGRRSTIARAALFVAAVLGVSRCVAATITWDPALDTVGGADASGTWDNQSSLDWYNGTRVLQQWNSATPDIAIFGNGGTAGTVTLGTGITAGGLVFNQTAASTSYTLNGNTLNLAVGSVVDVNNTSATTTINSTVACGSNGSGAFSVAGNGNLTFGTAVGTSPVQSLTVTMNGTGILTFAGSADNFGLQLIANSGTTILAKTGSGHAVGGGGLTIGGGLVQLGSNGDNIYDGANVTLTSGAFDTRDQSETINDLSLAGSGLGNTGALLNSGVGASTLTPNGGTTLTANTTVGVTNASASLTLNNTISGDYSFTKVGAGSLTLTAHNDGYTGTTTILGGQLVLTATAEIASGTGVNIVGSGGTLVPSTGFNLQLPVASSVLLIDDGQEFSGSQIVDHFGAQTITLDGGTIEYHAHQGPQSTSLQNVTIATGGQIGAQPESGNADLTINALVTNPTSTVTFFSQFGILGSAGQNPNAGTVHIGTINGTPTGSTLVNNLLGGWATTLSNSQGGGSGLTDFATYDLTAANVGVLAVTYDGTTIGNAKPTDNINAAGETLAPTTPTTYTVNALASNGGDIVLNQGAALVVNSGGVILGNTDHSIKSTDATGTITAGPGSQGAGSNYNLFVTMNGGGTNTRIDGVVITDNGPTPVTLVKAGIGQLILNAPNTYSGGTIINSGVLQLLNGGALGAANNVTTINPGGALDFGGQTTSGKGYTAVISGPGTANAGLIYSTGADNIQSSFDQITLAGDASIGGPGGLWAVHSGASTPEAIDGAGFHLLKVGPDRVSVLAPSINLAGFTINSGAILAGDDLAYGSVNGAPTPVVVNAGGTAAGSGGRVFANAFILNGGTLQENQNSSTDVRTGPITINGGATFNAGINNTLQFYSAGIQGYGTLVINGGGTVLFGGNPTSTAPLAESIALTGGSVIDVQAGTTRNEWANSAWGSNQAALQVDGGAKFDTWDGDTTVDYLAGAGTINKGWSFTNTLTFGVNNGSGSFSGNITATGNGDGTQVFNLVKMGTGTQAFSGANTYNGTTTLNAGMLLANTPAPNSATGTGSVIINAGARLAGGSASTPGNIASAGTDTAITIDAGGTITAGNGTSPLSTTGLLNSTGGTPGGNTPTFTQIWNGGGNYLWKVNAAAATTVAPIGVNGVGTTESPAGTPAGTNWDMLSMQTLNVAASPGAPFNIDVTPLGVSASSFDPSGKTYYLWTIADVTSANGIFLNGSNDAATLRGATSNPYGALLADFRLNAGGLASAEFNPNWFALNVISDGIGGEDIVVSYSSAPEPTSSAFLAWATGLLVLRRRRLNAQLARSSCEPGRKHAIVISD